MADVSTGNVAVPAPTITANLPGSAEEWGKGFTDEVHDPG